MSYNTKNYTEQNGEKTVIGGTLEIKNGATIEVKDGANVVGLSDPSAIMPATDESLGGVKASARTEESDTVEVKIGADNKLYVPSYPVVPADAIADNQAASTAADYAALLLDFNELLTKLKTAGIMVADGT